MAEQIILGINGYSRRVHDASACITIDGQLIAMAEEERFTRRKNAYGQVPHNAIAFCLNKADIATDQINTVAVGWDLDQVFNNIGKKPPTRDELLDLYLPKDRFEISKKPNLELIPHHVAHAASAYYLSGFEQSMVAVMDGQGENQATTIFRAQGNELQVVKEFDVKDSLGYFYEAVSDYVGLSTQDAGKTMGLASYGDPNYLFDLIRTGDFGYGINLTRPIQVEMDLQQEITGQWKAYLEERFGQKNGEKVIYDAAVARLRKQTTFPKHYKDVAASAQKTLERVVKHIITLYTNGDTATNLCIAGGVGLNCSMNGEIARAGLVKDLFVPPFSGDAGVAVGAALYVSDKKPNQRLRSASLGPEFSNETIATALQQLGIDYRVSDDIALDVAIRLAQNKTVDWFQGRMEAGPRALGNRSILGNPTDRDTHFRLNAIKSRETWRPLAPSIIYERLQDYVVDPASSPFMLRAFLVKPEVVTTIPAAVHIDGTTRAQTVTEDNGLYYRMIKEFDAISGIPVVMNTSFNADYEPIVCSPQDAIRTFFSTEADFLAMGDILIAKK